MVSPHPTLPIICTPRAIRWLRRAAIAILLAPVLLIAAIVGAGFYLSAPAPAVVGPPPAELGAEEIGRAHV